MGQQHSKERKGIMNQFEPSDISPLKEGKSGNPHRDKKTPTLPFGRYALGYGLPLSLAIIFLTFSSDTQPFDLLVRLLCVGFAALLGKQIISPQMSTAPPPPDEATAENQESGKSEFW